MKYAILVYESPEEFAEREDPALKGAYWAAYTAFGQSLGSAEPLSDIAHAQRFGSRDVEDCGR